MPHRDLFFLDKLYTLSAEELLLQIEGLEEMAVQIVETLRLPSAEGVPVVPEQATMEDG